MKYLCLLLVLSSLGWSKRTMPWIQDWGTSLSFNDSVYAWQQLSGTENKLPPLDSVRLWQQRLPDSTLKSPRAYLTVGSTFFKAEQGVLIHIKPIQVTGQRYKWFPFLCQTKTQQEALIILTRPNKRDSTQKVLHQEIKWSNLTLVDPCTPPQMDLLASRAASFKTLTSTLDSIRKFIP